MAEAPSKLTWITLGILVSGFLMLLYRWWQGPRPKTGVKWTTVIVVLTTVMVVAVAQWVVWWPQWQALKQAPAQQTTMLTSLAQKLKQQPDDPQAWWLLARSYSQTQQWQKALAAWEQAYQRLPNQPQVARGYAQALIQVEGRLSPKAQRLLDQADQRH